MLYSLRRFSENEIAPQRMKIIKFYDQYGEKAAKEAFGADRKAISRWKQRLTKSRGKLSSLIPLSTRPHKVRVPQIDPQITTFVKDQREAHPRIGKEKLKPDLDIYCHKLGIPTVSASTIGNIIKRNRFFFQKAGRMYHNPASKWVQNQTKKKKRLRIKHSPRPAEYGHILSDTVERITDGIKDYFLSAIDAKMKFALTLNYRHNNSDNMKDFYFKFKQVYPAIIKVWQSDNGKENLGVFDQQLEKDCIPHLFIYPNCPQVDTFIERYNRTLQEEFIDYHLDIIHDKKLFNQKLADWNIYYDINRRHHSLGLVSPLRYFVEKGGMSHKCLTYTTTCISFSNRVNCGSIKFCPMIKLLTVPMWFIGSIATILLSLWTYTFISASSLLSNPKVLGASSDSAIRSTLAYAAIPQAVSELKTEIKSSDARPLIINNYLAKFQSPMTGMGEFIVSKAEELGNRLPVDPTYLAFLTVAVGQNESNLGKKMPPNCFNAWGYGIHSAGTLCFQNWEEGITKFMTGVAENYITKRGLDTPEEMMTMYTPHSPNGAWAKGVKQFMEDLSQAGNK